MDSSLKPTESAVLEELRKAIGVGLEVDAGAMTCTELADALGICSAAVHRRISRLVRMGRLEVVRKELVDTYGRTQKVPAYRVAA